MTKLLKAIIFCFLIFAAGHSLTLAQAVNTPGDSLQLRERKAGTTAAMDQERQNARENTNRQQSGRNNQGQAVKRINGGRPDMSRARGARPPSVVRPSGKGIPKGVGKPGGAFRKMGR